MHEKIINRIQKYISEKDIEIEFGTNLDDEPCFIGDWSKYKKLGNVIEDIGAQIIWYDTHSYCTHCYRHWDTQPAYYGDERKGLWVSDCDVLCKHCAPEFIDDVIYWYQNETDKAIPSWLIEDIKKQGFFCLDEEGACKIFENGFYPGQNDNPAKIAKEIDQSKYDFIFAINSIGQFDLHFSIFLREKE